MITERLLQFIWQYQYFNKEGLRTTAGESLTVMIAGQFNENQGPDFLNAWVRIGERVWVGNIELHVDSNDWFIHGHDEDDGYANVILHVVWSDRGRNPRGVSVLELQDRVSVMLLDRYRQWMSGISVIPCAGSIATVDRLIWLSWKERLIAERLERRRQRINQWLASNRFHWEETLWWMIARNFGLTVNADAFEALARSINFSTLQRHRMQLMQLEALLFGQAGLLEKKTLDDYTRELKNEYRFLSRKYRLRRIMLPIHFLRMRPSSFPTIRLAQLARYIHEQSHPLQSILDSSLTSMYTVFDITAEGYWDTHFVFGKSSVFAEKNTGRQFVENMLINVVIPFLFAYGKHFNKPAFLMRAEEYLGAIGSEKNQIIRAFTDLGIPSDSAADSQFLVELRNSYCSQWKCVDCAIGNAILCAKPQRAS